MEVVDGYVLTAADYPSGTGMSYITWEQYTSPIHSDITINGSYSWGGMSADDNAELVESGEGEVNDPVEGSAETASVATTSTTTTTVTDYDYIYNGGQLTGEVITTTVDGTVTNTETLYYYYDASGTPVSVKYNNTLYFYVTNLQGDVIAIMNASGTIVVEYTYDAWGYIRNTTGSLKDTLGKANALRYRGYVYDTETCLYYLQSRYYNPGTGRFINADVYASTGQGLLGNNMFAYCLNNCINMADAEGTDAIYVTQTSGENSLPVVGHALLYVQDEQGVWYVTEFTGSRKPNARVRVYPADPKKVEEMLNGIPQDGKQYTVVEGDFSTSLELAKDYEKNNPTYGGYCLLTNNCLHYAREILLVGEFENEFQKACLINSKTIIPMLFHTDIVRSESYGVLKEAVCLP